MRCEMSAVLLGILQVHSGVVGVNALLRFVRCTLVLAGIVWPVSYFFFKVSLSLVLE